MSKEAINMRRMVALYNMLPNLFWTALNLIPISVFCFSFMTLKLFYFFLAVSQLAWLLPKSFFDRIQLGTTSGIYKKLGVNFINRFTQNGVLINKIIRKKFPHYKVISTEKLSVRKLVNQTYVFEKFHFTLFVFFILTTSYALKLHFFSWAVIMTINNLVYNVYPNLLQQYLRVRLTSIAGMHNRK